MTHIARDVRFGLRMLWKSPGQTAAAVLALGLGIGLTASMFSIVNGTILTGLPFERSDRLLHVRCSNLAKNEKQLPVFYSDFFDWRARQKSFSGIAAFDAGTMSLSGDDSRPERIDGAFASANTFDLLRVKPLLGRTFRAGDDVWQAEPVVVLGYGIWKSRYGGDPHIVGKTVRVNGKPSTVVGVMPAEFKFPVIEEVWAPLQLDPAKIKRGEGDGVEVIGRLKDGVTLEKAKAEMSGIARGIARDFPATNKGIDAVTEPFTRAYVGDEVSSLLYTMLGAVGFVLLIACANVASLMMARASQRTREVAIRSALGAGRRRVVAQILVESVLLSALGSLLGVALASTGLKLFVAAIAASNPPFWFRITLDPTSLVFVFAITVAAGLISGLAPALQASRANANEILKDEGRGSTSLRMGRFTRAIVVLEVAFSCALLVGAGLMIKSVVEVRKLNLGFESRDMLTLRIALFEAAYPRKQDRARFWEQLLPRLSALPGVETVAATSFLPTAGSETERYAVEGRAYATPQDLPSANQDAVSAGYFHAFGSRILAGRDFGRQDREGSLPVVIVNQSFAAKVWPRQEPLGRRLRLGDGKDGKAPWRTVVGLVPDLQMGGIDPQAKPEGFYLPIAQDCPVRVSVALKAHSDPLALTPLVRGEVTALDHDLPIYFVRSMEEVLAKSAFFFNLFGVLFSIFGVSALVLASVGIYGIIAFSVHQRTQEIGVRMALGAQKRNVLRMILQQGMTQLGLGLGIGLVFAFAVSRLLGQMLFRVQPSDPATFAAVCVVLATVALFACLIPAQRASRIDPLVAIRYD